MGYRKLSKKYVLEFEDSDYDGLEVVMRGVSVGEYLDLTDAMAAAGTREATEAMLKLVASKIVRWNLEDDDGVPIPATVAGLRSLDIDFVTLVTGTWMNAMVVPAPPLPGSSNGTGTIPPGSIPMESLSPSLPG